MRKGYLWISLFIYTVDLSGTTALIILLVAAIIAFAMLYPMMIPALASPTEPATGKMGFV